MKCPKCHYLSFEPEPRCKNCGYDFSLADSDLAIKPDDQPEGPLADLELHRRSSAKRRASVTLGPIHPEQSNAEGEPDTDTDTDTDTDRDAPAPPVATAPPRPDDDPAVTRIEADPAEPARRHPRRPPAVPTGELPLFVRGLPLTGSAPGQRSEEPPVVKVPPAPRPPLAVRRSGPEPARPRAVPPARRLGPFDRDLLEDLKRIEAQTAMRRPASESGIDAVSAMRRLAAACVDIVILGGISAAVIWFTLRQLGLDFGQVGVLPMAPLIAFFFLLDVGYLLLFTVAGGQTVGKMALGLRVIGAFPDEASSERLTVQQAAYRALLTVPSVLALGAGFVPALVGQGRAFHDRLAHTRVVNA